MSTNSGPTESRLTGTESLHDLPPEQLLSLFEEQDLAVVEAVRTAADSIAELGRRMHRAIERGGRIIHVGAGTSGRLGVLDAAEWPPTFGIEPGRVLALMAGGDDALVRAVEGAEDRVSDEELDSIELDARDLVNGISASGGARFVRSAIAKARSVGAERSWISCNPFPDDDPDLCQVVLATGSEVLAGSTRLKAATATQLTLQRASNICAVLSGWVHAGRMVNMRPTNEKLRRRAIAIVADLGRIDTDQARELLETSNDEIKTAIVRAHRHCTTETARTHLAAVNGVLASLEEFRSESP